MSQARHSQFKDTMNGQKAPTASLFEHGNKILAQNHERCLVHAFLLV